MQITAALDLLLALLNRSQEISNMIANAAKEKRDTLTDAEWAQILAAADKADEDLSAAIAARKG